MPIRARTGVPKLGVAHSQWKKRRWAKAPGSMNPTLLSKGSRVTEEDRAFGWLFSLEELFYGKQSSSASAKNQRKKEDM